MFIPAPQHHLSRVILRSAVVTALSFAVSAGAEYPAASPGYTTVSVAVPTLAQLHDTDQWHEIQKHLPDPATASADDLEMQADILRARRFPEDAMDYYRYALARGGNPAELINKMGLAELEMHHMQLGRVYFQRVVKLDKKNAEAWNNLGASEYMDGRTATAVSDYKKAIKLSRRNAVFHANLASADFEQHDYSGSRREIATALELDPHVFETEGNGGIAAHVLSQADQARFSFEMAKMYARTSMEADMLHALGKAADAGLDIRREMEKDEALAKYSGDPRVLELVRKAELVRATRTQTITVSDGSATFGRPSTE